MTLIQIVFLAVLCLSIGLVSAFFGYPLMRFLLPIWAFLAGLGTVFTLIADGFIGWVLGVLVGLVAACLTYLFLTVGLAIVGAAFGASLSATLVTAAGFDPNTGFIVNLGVAIIFSGIAVVFSKYFVMAATSLAGATGVVTGLLLLLPNGLAPEQIQLGGPVDPLLKSSIVAVLLWIILSGAAMIHQYRTSHRLDVTAEDEEEMIS